MTINTGTGEISGTPTAVGSSTVTITATDTDGESVSSNEFAIIATDVPNAIPVFNGPIQNQTGIVGEAVTPLALADFFSDIDTDDTLSIALTATSTLPAGLLLSLSLIHI